MSKSVQEETLNQRALLFKALGHPARLLILNLIQMKPRHGEELAAILNLKPATISHHLARLTEVGLLKSEKDQYYQIYTLVSGVLDQTLEDVMQLSKPSLTEEVEEDAFSSKVIRTFIKQGRLVQFPSQYKKQQVVLEYIAKEFEPGKKYSEREVNQILLDFNEDVASLRRGIIDMKIMEREKGVYWLPIKEK